VRIIADSNILLRAFVGDDPKQEKLAQAVLAAADLVAIPTVALCEFVWVLKQGYKKAPADIAATIRVVVAAENVVTNRQAIEAGLSLLEEGADFADGVIAHEGKEFGGDTFVSFDKDAVKLLARHGVNARVPT
jgi:predicted nucleic-acid-binding protein